MADRGAGILDGQKTQNGYHCIVCRLSTLAAFVIPFGNIVGPLVVWLIKKDQYPLVQDQGNEALNFQISMTIYFIVAAFSIFVLVGFVLVPALIICDIVFTVIAAMKANSGECYRYPWTIRLVT